MRLLYTRKRFKKRNGEHSYRGWHRAVLGCSWLDWFRPCPTIFKIEQTPGSDFPFRSLDKKKWKAYSPALDTIAGQQLFLTLVHNDTMRGKIKIEHYLSAWYSTFMHDDPADGIMERVSLHISFSHKPSAMLFKMMFACPELKVVQVAHS